MSFYCVSLLEGHPGCDVHLQRFENIQLAASVPPVLSEDVWKSIVRSSRPGISFLLRCCDLLYFIKNECELDIKCCAFGGFILCTLLFFCPISTGDGVLTSSCSWGICWHIQWTIPSLWPPLPFSLSQRLHGSFVLLLFVLPWPSLPADCVWIYRIIDLQYSIFSLWRKVHPSYFKRFYIDLHALYIYIYLFIRYWIFISF